MEPVPELFIDGTWVSAQEGGRREIRCPADGTLVAEIDESDRGDTEAAIAAARRAFDAGPWPRTWPASAATCCCASPTCSSATRPTIARMESLDTGKRLVESEYDVDDVVQRLPPLRPGRRAEDAGRVVDTGIARRGQPGRARAGRRLRADHAVELPAAAGRPGRSPRASPPATPSCSSPASSRRTPRST